MLENLVHQFKESLDELQFDSIKFPVSLDAIDRFETLNRNLDVNVFGNRSIANDEDNKIKLNVYQITGTRHVIIMFLTNIENSITLGIAKIISNS